MKPSTMYRISVLKPLDFIYDYTLEVTCSTFQVVRAHGYSRTTKVPAPFYC